MAEVEVETALLGLVVAHVSLPYIFGAVAEFVAQCIKYHTADVHVAQPVNDG